MVCVGGSAGGLEAYTGPLNCQPARVAQTLSTAAQPDMPQSAIDTVCTDAVLSPEDTALEIRPIALAHAWAWGHAGLTTWRTAP